MKWIEVILKTHRDNEDLLVDKLYEYNIDGVNVEDENLIFDVYEHNTDWELIDLPDSEPGDVIKLKVFFDTEEYDGFIKRELRDYIGSVDYEVEIVDEVILDNMDWATEWKKYYKVFKLGEKLVIKPSWEDYDASKDEIVIDIDPGMAFGTGTHASTYLCLEIMEEMGIGGKNIIDIGTGSGILAIAAAKLGAKSVTAIDLDPVCISTTTENSKLNKCEDIIDVFEADLTKGIDGIYDVALINIIAEVIVELLDYLHENLKHGSKVILSGIINENAQMVYDKLDEMGYIVVSSRQKDGWTAIHAEYRNA